MSNSLWVAVKQGVLTMQQFGQEETLPLQIFLFFLFIQSETPTRTKSNQSNDSPEQWGENGLCTNTPPECVCSGVFEGSGF